MAFAYDCAMSSVNETSQRILDRCRELGFALAGIAEALPTRHERELLEWLAAGKHGEMEYLRRNVELRIDPRNMVPGAKSVICVADRYDAGSPLPSGERLGVRAGASVVAETTHASATCMPSPQPSPTGRGSPATFGRVARYARGDDYHVVMRKRLAKLCKELAADHSGETFRACVDTAPVLEREIAQRAGIGAVGKNTLIIERGVGSYLLLGEIITTLQLVASRPSEPDPCGACTRCIDACPTQAIAMRGWSVDATRCISYLTIEHRGLIELRMHEAMGDWIFGCDICQQVCPHNQPTERSVPRMEQIHPGYQPRREGFDLLEILNWDEEARRAAFAKSSMKRARLDMMKRNALIAAGNSLGCCRNEMLIAAIQRIAQDANENDLVRETASVVAGSFTTADTDTAVTETK